MIPGALSRSRHLGARNHWWPWLPLAVTAAIIVTAVEALLLERKLGVFTGGFLAMAPLTRPVDRIRFMLISLAADAALLALPAWVACRVSAWLRLGRVAGTLLAGIILLTPVAVADVVKYEIAQYVGDRLDFSRAVDLGEHRGELLAIGWKYLQSPVTAGIAATLAALTLIGAVQQWLPAGTEMWLASRRGLVRAVVITIVGLLVIGTAAAVYPSYSLALNWKASGAVFGRMVRTATDFDRDGWGLFDHPVDGDLFDARIHPYAIDVPGNGLDEDGIGGDLPRAAAVYKDGPPLPSARWSRTPNIVMVLLESVRGDVIGATEGGRPITPVMNALAAGGYSARHAYSHNGFTAESRHHLFTGSLANLRGSTSLVDDFKANGYQVAYFSGQDESFGGPALMVGARRADVFFDATMARNERYTLMTTAASLAVPFGTVERRVNAFLAERTDTRPLFLYINLEDTHFPYWHEHMVSILNHTVVPQEDIGPGRRREVREMYLNSVANIDASIGRLLKAVNARFPTPPAVIITSDHGESLLEDDFLGHGYTLQDNQTRIPFITAGLDLGLTEPFGQVDVRDALWRTLGASAPAAEARSGPPPGTVFQYIGTVQRPRQIGERRADGQVVVDLESNRVQFGDGVWRDPASLTGAETDRFHEVVWFWESLALARYRAHQDE